MDTLPQPTRKIPPLPDSVRVIIEPTATRIFLPQRPFSPVRLSALIPLSGGILLCAMSILWILAILGLARSLLPHLPPLILSFFFLPVALFLLYAGALLARNMLALLIPGHAELLLTADHILQIQHSRPVHLRTRRERRDITVLRIADAVLIEKDARSRGFPSYLPGCQLVLAGGTKKPTMMAVSYPRALILPLAHLIVAHLHRLNPSPPVHVDTVIADQLFASRPALLPETPERPPHSTVQLVATSQQWTFIIPPLGWRSVHPVLLACGSAIALLCLGFAIRALRVGIQHHDLADIIVPLFFTAFILFIATATLCNIFSYARSKAVIVATPDTLTLSQSSGLMQHTLHWKRPDLVAIRAAPGVTRGSPELQLLTTDGTIHRFFANRNPDDLAWLATTLRNQYHLPSVPQP